MGQRQQGVATTSNLPAGIVRINYRTVHLRKTGQQDSDKPEPFTFEEVPVIPGVK